MFANLPPRIHRLAIRYLLPLFALTLSYNPPVHSRDRFYQAVIGSFVQYYLVEWLFHGKGALVLSALSYALAVFFPGLFFLSYGLVLSQAYNTGVLISDKRCIGVYAFRMEMLGLVISRCIVIPVYVQMAMAMAVFALVLDTERLATQADDPQQTMERLIVGLDPSLPSDSLKSGVLLYDPPKEDPLIDGAVTVNYGMFENRRTLRHYKLLCAEYKAYIRNRPSADRLQFGLFHLMFLLSTSISLFLFSLVNPFHWPWTVLAVCGAVLLDWPWTWMALFADFAVGGHVPSRLLSGYLAYIIVEFARLDNNTYVLLA